MLTHWLAGRHGGGGDLGAARIAKRVTVVRVARILVVDDMPSIRFLIRTNFELAEHEVFEAFDGQDCLDKLELLDPLPDVVTMDMMMPRMSGLTAVERIRRNPRTSHIVVVMVTTQGQQIDITRASGAGVDVYVTKPFDPDHLVATVEQSLKGRR